MDEGDGKSFSNINKRQTEIPRTSSIERISIERRGDEMNLYRHCSLLSENYLTPTTYETRCRNWNRKQILSCNNCHLNKQTSARSAVNNGIKRLNSQNDHPDLSSTFHVFASAVRRLKERLTLEAMICFSRSENASLSHLSASCCLWDCNTRSRAHSRRRNAIWGRFSFEIQIVHVTVCLTRNSQSHQN